jgi:hypothetical protein
MQALTPHAYAQVARALRPPCASDRHRTGLGVEISRHMPYMKDLQWLSGEAAYQNS